MAHRSSYSKGVVIAKDYRIKRKIGEGQFAEVYEVEEISTNQCVGFNTCLFVKRTMPRPRLIFIRFSLQLALKIEKSGDARTLKQEIRVIKHMQGCRHFPSLRHNGLEDGKAFAVLDLFGHNLAEVKKLNGPGVLPLFVTKHICLLLLNALETFHSNGYIHRDIKPANFIAERNASTQTPEIVEWYLIDFGLARKYREDDGSIIPERPDASFRGSTTYASIHSHDEKDLSRRDDLWSWFYIIIELTIGSLPWRTTARIDTPTESTGAHAANNGCKGSVAEIKRDCILRPLLLFGGLSRYPSALVEMHEYLCGLTFESAPEYARLRELLEKVEYDALMPVRETPAQRPTVKASGDDRVDGSFHKGDPAPLPENKSHRHAEHGSRHRNGHSHQDYKERERRKEEDKDSDKKDNKKKEYDQVRREEEYRRHRSSSINKERSRSRSRQRRKRSDSPHRDRLHRRDQSRSRSLSRDREMGAKKKKRGGRKVREKERARRERDARELDARSNERKDEIARKLLRLAPKESLDIMCTVIDDLVKSVDGKRDGTLNGAAQHLMKQLTSMVDK